MQNQRYEYGWLLRKFWRLEGFYGCSTMFLGSKKRKHVNSPKIRGHYQILQDKPLGKKRGRMIDRCVNERPSDLWTFGNMNIWNREASSIFGIANLLIYGGNLSRTRYANWGLIAFKDRSQGSKTLWRYPRPWRLSNIGKRINSTTKLHKIWWGARPSSTIIIMYLI